MMKLTLTLCYLAFCACVLLASGDGSDKSTIDRALVTVDSEAPVIVYSLHFYYDYPVEIVIGHSHYEISFKNIKELEIYNEDGLNAHVKDINGNETEGRLDYGWELVGITKENGFEGKFSVYPSHANKIKVVRMDEDGSPQETGGEQNDQNARSEEEKERDNNKENNDTSIINIIKNTWNNYISYNTNYNLYLEIGFSLLSVSLIAMTIYSQIQKRKKHALKKPENKQN